MNLQIWFEGILLKLKTYRLEIKSVLKNRRAKRNNKCKGVGCSNPLDDPKGRGFGSHGFCSVCWYMITD